MLFTLQYALHEFWTKFLGRQADAFIGHSDGEYASIHFSGICDFETITAIVAERDRFFIDIRTNNLAEKHIQAAKDILEGGMYVVGAPVEKVEKILEAFNEKHKNDASLFDSIQIGVENSPLNAVIAGKHTNIEIFKEFLKTESPLNAKDILLTKITVLFPFHCKLIYPVRELFKERLIQSLESIKISRKLEKVDDLFNIPTKIMISTLTGTEIKTKIRIDQFVDMTAERVEFLKAVRTLQSITEQQQIICLELGPNNQITRIGQQIVQSSKKWKWYPTFDMKREEDNENVSVIRETALSLFQDGYRLNYDFFPQTIRTEVPKSTISSNSIDNAMEKEPIAIIGYSCHLPGSILTPEEYWEAMINGKDCMTETPKGRFNFAALSELGLKFPKFGGWLNVPEKGNDIFDFDLNFFEINAVEGTAIDPQHRIMLEVMYEALERANIPSRELPKRYGVNRVAVGAGLSMFDYGQYSTKYGRINSVEPPGTAFSAASGRMAMYLGTQGPTFTVDTACSTSHALLHLLKNSLLARECDIAIATTANLKITLEGMYSLMEASMLCEDGKCKVFDESANGYGRSEGACCIILKRLSDAKRDGDIIHGVIYGSRIGQDGARKNITTPNSVAQAQLYKDTLEGCGIDPAKISYIECHGTGTPVGDPTEIRSITEIYGGLSRQQPLILGAVKSNIGHTETVAGMAGLIKALLVYRHDVIPMNLHFKNPAPSIDLKKIPAIVPVSSIDFKREGQNENERLVAVSAFGYSGTIGHMIIGDKDMKLPIERKDDEESLIPKLLTFSGKSKSSVLELIQKFGKVCEDSESGKQACSIADVAYSLNTGRNHYPDVRACVVASSMKELHQKIQNLDEKGSKNGFAFHEANATGMKKKRSQTVEETPFALMFTGQGSQYKGMGKDLYKEIPAFRQYLTEATDSFKPFFADVDFLGMILGESSNWDISRTLYSQPAIFCIEYALAKLWIENFGIKPKYVCGHSIGEVCGAVICNILDLENAAKLISMRSKAMDALQANENGVGTMYAVIFDDQNDRAKLDQALTAFKEKEQNAIVEYAAINSYTQIVLSGFEKDILAFLDHVTNEKLLKSSFRRVKLSVSNAFHSSLMNPCLKEFEENIKDIKFNYENASKDITFVSTLKGRIIEYSEINTQYWVDHIKNKVNFLGAFECLISNSATTFIEIGAKPILTNQENQINDLRSEKLEFSPIFVPSIVSDKENSLKTVLQGLGMLYLNNRIIPEFDPNLKNSAFFQNLSKMTNIDGKLPQKLDFLPTYQFSRVTVAMPEMEADMVLKRGVHPFLNKFVSSQVMKDKEIYVFESKINRKWPDFLLHHHLYEKVVVAGASYLSAAIAAVETLFRFSMMKMRKIDFLKPLVLEGFEYVKIQTILELLAVKDESEKKNDDEKKTYKFSFCSQREGDESDEWSVHVNAIVEVYTKEELKYPDGNSFDVTTVKQEGVAKLTGTEARDFLFNLGLDLGKKFQWNENMFIGKDMIMSELRWPVADETVGYRVHPGALDSVFQTTIGSMFDLQSGSIQMPNIFIPFSIDEIAISSSFSSPKFVMLDKTKAQIQPNQSTVSVTMLSNQGIKIGHVNGLTLRAAPKATLFRALENANSSSKKKKEGSTQDAVQSQFERIDKILFKVRWDPQPLSGIHSTARGKYLIFGNLDSQTEKFVALLKKSFFDVEVVLRNQDENYQNFFGDKAKCFIHDDFSDQGLSNLLQPKRKKIDHIVYMWGNEISTNEYSAEFMKNINKDITQIFFNLAKFLINNYNSNVPRVWVISHDSYPVHRENFGENVQNLTQAPLIGLSKSFSVENPEFACTHVDFASRLSNDFKGTNLLNEIMDNDFKEWSVCYDKNEVRNVMRVIPSPETAQLSSATKMRIPDYYYEIKKTDKTSALEGKSLLRELHTVPLEQKELNFDPEDRVVIENRSVGLNFRDVLGAMNQYPNSHLGFPLGNDFAGVVVQVGKISAERFKIGDRVFGTTSSGCFQSLVILPSCVCHHMPDQWSFAQAASIATTFLTAFFCLVYVGKMDQRKEKKRVLIHNATGGVGLAQIIILQKLSEQNPTCPIELFCTVGRDSKRKYLMDNFGISADHIFDSRNSSEFRDKILDVTKNDKCPGVDFIINTVTGQGFIESNFSCLAKNGYFHEISKINIWKEEDVKQYRPDVHYRIVAMDREAAELTGDVMRVLREFFIEHNCQFPPVTVFSAEDCIDAFIEMSNSNHIGKICITFPPPIKTPKISEKTPKDIANYVPANSWLITGGLGGIGLKVCDHLVKKMGAKFVILIGRSGPDKEKQELIESIMNESEKTGTRAKVVFRKCDIGSETDTKALFDWISSECPRLIGILHTAGVIKDGAITSQNWERFEDVFSPKIVGSLNIHTVLQKYHKRIEENLCYFVVFSSVVSVFGSAGQCNYTAANFFLDSFVHWRRNQRLTATAVNWGAWGSVGMAVDTIGEKKLKQLGMTLLEPEVGVSALEHIIAYNEEQVLCCDTRFEQAVESQPELEAMMTEIIAQKQKASGHTKEMKKKDTDSSLLSQMKQLPADQHETALNEYILDIIAKILDVDRKNIGKDVFFGDMGLDSLSSQIIRNKLLLGLNGHVEISIGEMIHYSSVSALSKYILSQLPKKILERPQEDSQAKVSANTELTPNQSRMMMNYEILPDEDADIYHEYVIVAPKKKFKIGEINILSIIQNMLKLYPEIQAYVKNTSQGELFMDTKQMDTIENEKFIQIIPFKTSQKTRQEELDGWIGKKFDIYSPPFLRICIFATKDNEIEKILLVGHSFIFSKNFMKQISAEFISQVDPSYAKQNVNDEEKAINNFQLNKKETDWKQKNSGIYQENLNFWEEYLKDISWVIPLPTEVPRKNKHNFKFNTCEIMKETKFESKKEGETETIKAFIISLISFVLYKVSSLKGRFAIGMSECERNSPSSEEKMTFEMLPFRIDDPIADLFNVEKVKKDHQEFFEKCQEINTKSSGASRLSLLDVMDHLKMFPTSSIHPIFQTGICLIQESKNSEDSKPAKNEWSFELSSNSSKKTMLDLNFKIVFSENTGKQNNFSIKASVDYNENLFKEKVIAKWFKTFPEVLSEFLKQKTVPKKLIDKKFGIKDRVPTLFSVGKTIVDKELVENIIKRHKWVKDCIVLPFKNQKRNEIQIVAVVALGDYLAFKVKELTTYMLRIANVTSSSQFIDLMTSINTNFADEMDLSVDELFENLKKKSYMNDIVDAVVGGSDNKILSAFQGVFRAIMAKDLSITLIDEMTLTFETLLKRMRKQEAAVLTENLIGPAQELINDLKKERDREIIQEMIGLCTENQVPLWMLPQKVILVEKMPSITTKVESAVPTEGESSDSIGESLNISQGYEKIWKKLFTFNKKIEMALKDDEKGKNVTEVDVVEKTLDLARSSLASDEVLKTIRGNAQAATADTLKDALFSGNKGAGFSFENIYGSPRFISQKRVENILRVLLNESDPNNYNSSLNFNLSPTRSILEYLKNPKFLYKFVLRIQESFSIPNDSFNIKILDKYPTMESASLYLEPFMTKDMLEKNTDSERKNIITIAKPEKPIDEIPLFMVHPATGLSFVFFSLKNVMKIPVYGINNPKFDKNENPYMSIFEMAEEYVKEIRILQPHGPYRLSGWSFGGNVALEMAIILKSNKYKEKVDFVLLFDSFNTSLYRFTDKMNGILDKMDSLFHKGKDKKSVQSALEKEMEETLTLKAADELKSASKQFTSLPQIIGVGGSNQKIIYEVFHNAILGSMYHPTPKYNGRVILFKVQQPVEPFYEIHEELFNGWDDAKLTVPIELVSIPGNHYNLFMSEFVGIVSEKIHEIVNGGAKAIADTFILQKTDLPIYDRYILYFAKRNDGFFVEWMVDKCAANVNCQDFEGRTALHHAVLHENKRTVQYLMEKGANVEICDTRGDSPLSIMKDKIDVFIDVLNSIKK